MFIFQQSFPTLLPGLVDLLFNEIFLISQQRQLFLFRLNLIMVNSEMVKPTIDWVWTFSEDRC